MDGRPRATAILAVTALAMALAVLVACGGEGPAEPAPLPSPLPSPTGLPGATPGRGTGPTALALVAADPPLGATVTGCGTDAAGCTGRIRMTFRLVPADTGAALWAVAFLHAPDKTACLQGRTDGFDLRAGEVREIEVIFDAPDTSGRCRTPLDLTDLALTLEGTVEVASRQEWALSYRLAP